MKLRLPASRRTRVILIIVGLVVALIVWRNVRPAPPPVLATSPVVKGDIENTVVATGSLEAFKLVSVGAQASGQIRSLKVQLGDKVKAGDLIAEIDPTTQLNNVRNAEAVVTSTRAQRAVQTATLRQAELAFERQKMMIADEATSKADYETAEAQLATTKAQIEALDAQIEQGRTQLATAKANLGYTKIAAPIDGTIVAVVVKEGQTVNAVQSAPTIVKLANLDVMTVSAQISEADVIKVQPGQTAYFTILGNPDKRYYGKLRSIEPAPESVQTETSTTSSSTSSNTTQAIYYNGQFEVPNTTGELRISMTAQVYLVLGDAKDALVIPSAALSPRGRDGSYSVQVVGNDRKPVPPQGDDRHQQQRHGAGALGAFARRECRGR
ncbi:MAG: efflux RND transporter periplasmic adaptor subunit [Gammaproteobacteria bacterium]